MPNGGTLEQAKEMEEMMLVELAWLWPVGILAIGSILAVVLAMVLPRDRQGLVGAWAAAAHLGAAGTAVEVWLNRGFTPVMEGVVMVDGLSLTLAALIGVSGALCVALARPVVAGTDREGEFYALLTFASLSATLLDPPDDKGLYGLARFVV